MIRTKMLSVFQSARRAGAPFVAVRTADARACQTTLAAAVDDLNKSGDTPMLEWTASTGIVAVNKAGEALLESNVMRHGMDTIGFPHAMVAAADMPRLSVLFVHHAHRQLQSQEPGTTASSMQAIANNRDTFKNDHRQLVFVGPVWTSPIELEHDVLVLNEELPTPDELATLVIEVANGVKVPKGQPPVKAPTGRELESCVDALSGLSIFAAEQVASMCVTVNGFDIEAMWERKIVTINQTPGLKVYRGKEKFSDIVGQEGVKAKLTLRKNARSSVGVVVMIEEIDKAMANIEGDTTGVRTYQAAKLLTEMEDNRWPGLIAAGVAGGGKSLIAKSFGNEVGAPTIVLDLGASESKWVGESQANANRIIDVIKAMGRGRAYFIATSNAATIMRPELQRRFFDGIWMFDLMTAAERKACWRFYMKKFELPTQQIPADDMWTGAEIRNCCESAWDCRTSLIEASKSIIPMAQSRGDEIERLRTFAHGKLLDASAVGATYRYDKKAMAKGMRAIALDADAVS